MNQLTLFGCLSEEQISRPCFTYGVIHHVSVLLHEAYGVIVRRACWPMIRRSVPAVILLRGFGMGCISPCITEMKLLTL